MVPFGVMQCHKTICGSLECYYSQVRDEKSEGQKERREKKNVKKVKPIPEPPFSRGGGFKLIHLKIPITLVTANKY